MGTTVEHITAGDFSKLGGLDSLSPGKLDLRLSTGDCPEDLRLEVWRWLSYQLTHVGAAHVIMNCTLNFLLGVPLEGMHGAFRTGLMFNVGVLGGSLCYFVNDARSTVVGMSGGCYALIGINFADLLMNWAEKKFRKATLLFLSFIVMVDVAVYYFSTSATNVSHSVHVGGFIAGGLSGIIICKNLKVHSRGKWLKPIAGIISTVLFLFCIGWLMTNSEFTNIWNYADEETSQFCWTKQVWLNELQVDDGPNPWRCVRCACDDSDCQSKWQSQQHIEDVDRETCIAAGFYADEC